MRDKQHEGSMNESCTSFNPVTLAKKANIFSFYYNKLIVKYIFTPIAGAYKICSYFTYCLHTQTN